MLFITNRVRLGGQLYIAQDFLHKEYKKDS